ncbi:MAG: hypothetical protein MJH10_14645 [Epibacterium sp.]|nr:hypothetical protein [Epibacterium sp.]NQX74766.1 hypothetical protein [Epibacterium sp.]
MGIFGDILGGVIGGAGSLWAGNEMADDIRDATREFTVPFANTGIEANNFLQNFLMGQDGRQQLDAFNQSTGGQFLMDQGRRAILGNQAAGGKLNSGATGKALAEFGQNLASTQMNNFLSQIDGLANRGAAAGAQAVNSFGQAASAQQQGREGAGSVLGDLIGSIF